MTSGTVANTPATPAASGEPGLREGDDRDRDERDRVAAEREELGRVEATRGAGRAERVARHRLGPRERVGDPAHRPRALARLAAARPPLLAHGVELGGELAELVERELGAAVARVGCRDPLGLEADLGVERAEQLSVSTTRARSTHGVGCRGARDRRGTPRRAMVVISCAARHQRSRPSRSSSGAAHDEAVLRQRAEVVAHRAGCRTRRLRERADRTAGPRRAAGRGCAAAAGARAHAWATSCRSMSRRRDRRPAPGSGCSGWTCPHANSATLIAQELLRNGSCGMHCRSLKPGRSPSSKRLRRAGARGRRYGRRFARP